jgi:predicted acylesterase/phospholipase RssA
MLLAGCQTVPRLAAPPHLIGTAAPDGFPASVRLVTTDLRAYRQMTPGVEEGLRKVAHGGPIEILALSGGGSGGAFGAGVLTGLSQAATRPRFEMVTGVSAGALLAPFAFLGPDWDARMQQAFTGKYSTRLLGSPARRLLLRLVSPRALPHRNPLYQLVDHFVTPHMIEAVAAQAATGRQLIVATTDLDKHETVLWNLGAIARHGGPAARALFRDVLVASASVPGVFPPMLIRVRDGQREYDEMHVDGGITTSVFSMPLIAGIQLAAMPALRGAHLYIIVNGQLAHTVHTTPYNTVDILANALDAELTYKTREAIVQDIAAAQRLDMQLSLASIPADYPQSHFIDFDQASLLALFRYARRCAAAGALWVSPSQSVLRNVRARPADSAAVAACPVSSSPPEPRSASPQATLFPVR